MRTIDEIKADLKRAELNLKACLHEDGGLVSHAQWDVDRLKVELFDRLTHDIPLDRLEEICEAERDGRLVVLPCGVDLMKIYNELTSVCEGDEVENYTNGYRRGHKNGQIELIRRILNISEGVSHKPEQALKGGR